MGIAGAVAAYFLAKKFEPEVKNAVVYELNRHLSVPVDVEDINLSLLQRFPFASLRFSHVTIPEVGKENPDTLIYIEDLYLQIGLLDFLKKDYTVSEADVNNGFFRMEIRAGGKNNYEFWKAGKDSAGASLSLTDIHLKDVTYSLKTDEDLFLEILVRDGSANGNFGEKTFSLNSEVDLLSKSVRYRDEILYENLEVSGDVELLIDGKMKVYSFKSDDVNLGSEDYTMEGAFDESGKDAFWRLKLGSKATDLPAAVQLVPIPNQDLFKKYKPEGSSDFDLDLSTKTGFDLTLAFAKLEGEFTHSESSGRALVSSGRGLYTLQNGVSSIRLESLQGKIGPGRFLASGEVRNFDSPDFDLNLEGRLELNELKNFLNITFAEILEGRIDVNGKLNGKITAKELTTERILRGVNFLGAIKLQEGALKTTGRTEDFEEIQGNFEIVDNAIRTEKLSAKVGSNRFELKGEIQNALPYLIGEGERINILADLNSESIKLEELLGKSENPDASASLYMPENVGFDLVLNIGELSYRDFTARNLSGRAIYNNGLFTLNPFVMNLASGSLSGRFSLREDAGGFLVSSDAAIKSMRADQLFYAFENFGQEIITSKRIEGTIGAAVDFSCKMDTTLKINTQSIVADVDLRVDNGKLKQIPSIVSIADYIEDNAVWDAFVKTDVLRKKLENVEFETIRNNLSIANEEINIPEMKISTSVMELTASGRHSFKNEIDYSVSFRLSELLRTGKTNENEFGYVVDDGTGLRIFLIMEGTVDNPEFSNDKSTAREKRKEKFEREKSTVKGILKKEFGLFKSDSTATLPDVPEKESGPKFEVEWGDPDTLSGKKKKGKKKKKLSKEDEDLYRELEDDDDL